MSRRTLMRPLLSLTKAQWKSVLRHVDEKLGGAFTKEGARKFTGLEPPTTETFGRLYEDKSIQALKRTANLPPGESLHELPERVVTSNTLPLAEARAKYMQDPERYWPGHGEPDMLRMSPIAPQMSASRPTTEQGMIDDLLKSRGISYQRAKFGNVKTPTFERKRALKGELDDIPQDVRMDINETLGTDRLPPGSLGQLPPDTAPAAAAEAAAPASESVVSQLNNVALEGEKVWKALGGARSLAGKTWEMQYGMSKLRGRYSNTKEYFIGSWIRYFKDPTEFAQKNPREANLIRQIIEKLSQGGE